MIAYWSLLQDVSELSATLKLALARATHSTVEGACYLSTIKCNFIKSLTAQAMLHRLLATNSESRRMSAESALEVVSVAESLTEDEYLFIDVVIGVSHSCLTL